MAGYLLHLAQIADTKEIIDKSFEQSFGIGVLVVFFIAVCSFCFSLWKQQNKREKEFVDMIVVINSEMVKVVSENTSAVSKLQQSIDFLFKHTNNNNNNNNRNGS